MKSIANEGRVITITPNGGWTPATPVYIELKAIFAKAGGQKIIKSPISWTITGCSFPGGFSGGGGGVIAATAQKCSFDGLNPIREDDGGTCSGVLTGPGGATVSCSCGYRVTNAGQSKVKGE